MGKVICDVCGTSFPDTTEQCPICGCVRSADAVVMSEQGDAAPAENGTYAHVRGGRFSKSNVKKRNSTKQEKQDDPQRDKKRNKSDKGLVIAVLALLFCIVAVSVYITIRFDPFGWFAEKAQVTTDNTATVSEDETDNKPEVPDDRVPEDETPKEIPCTGIELSTYEITLNAVGATETIVVTVNPADTTDPVLFASGDKTVADVDTDGNVVAVSEDETVITVTCGEFTKECVVICKFDESEENEEEENTQEPENEPVDVFSVEAKGNALVDDKVYRLNTYMEGRDFQIPANAYKELTLRDENGEYMDITIHENSAYCTIEGNVIRVSADAPYHGIITLRVVYGNTPGDYIECSLQFV